MTHQLTLQLTDEQQQQRIETLARQRGYRNTTDYLLALVAVDAEHDVLDQYDFVDDPEQDAIDLEAEFREAWRSAMTGEGLRPIEDLLAELDAEDDDVE
jgi:hypothetical protein